MSIVFGLTNLKNHVISKNKGLLIHVILSIGLFLLAAIIIQTRVFFVSDVGIRYLQIINLVRHNWQTFTIDYPGAFVDDKLEFVPYYYAYSVNNHQIYLNISPFFPLLTSILYKQLGVMGLAIVPAIAGILIGWGVKEIVRLHSLPYPDLMFWVAILGTPILFYCLQLWDHTLGVAFSTWAVYFLLKGKKLHHLRSYFWGGILLGLGMGQRPELYVFALAAGLSLLILDRFKAPNWVFFLGGIAGILPVGMLQTLWYGHPLGTMIGGELLGYGRPENYPFSYEYRVDLPRYTKIGLFLYQIDQNRPVITVLTLLLLLTGLLLIVHGIRKGQKPNMIYVGLLLFVISNLITISTHWGQPIQGLLSTFPLIPLSLVLSRGKSVDDYPLWQGYKFIGLVVAIFLIIMFIIWPADGGLQWGARYLLPIYPLLLYLAIHSYNDIQHRSIPRLKKVTQIAGVTLLILSIFLQIMSVYTLQRAINVNAKIRDWISELPVEVILTNAPYLQAGMASLDNIFLYVDSTTMVSDALVRLAEKGISQVAVIPLEAIDLPMPDKIPGYTVIKIGPIIYRLQAK